MTPQAWFMKEKCDKYTLLKLKTCFVKETIKKMKDKPHVGENICKTYMIKDFCPKYTKNS